MLASTYVLNFVILQRISGGSRILSPSPILKYLLNKNLDLIHIYEVKLVKIGSVTRSVPMSELLSADMADVQAKCER